MIVSESVIEARVRRAVARDGEILCRPRGERARQELGNYFTVDAHTGNPQRWHLELEQLAREHGVLRPCELLADAGVHTAATSDAMPAGRYWVGDLCYVLRDVWDCVCMLGDGAHVLPDGRRVAVFSTVHGDGTYNDEHGREYPVDSGIIGCVRAADIRRIDARIDLGAFVTADEPFAPGRTYPAGSCKRWDGGVLELAGVRIHLDRDDDDEAAD